MDPGILRDVRPGFNPLRRNGGDALLALARPAP
jgi:hypothetical protein